MTLSTRQRLTLQEYLDYDDGTDTRYELVDGVLVEMPPESRLNHRIASFLFGEFFQLGISTELLTIGVQIAVSSLEVTARQPDFVVLSTACAEALESASKDVITVDMPPPALVVEVVSPGEPGEPNYDRDYIEKRREYAQRGIQEYWIVDPSREAILVLTLKETSYEEQRFTGQTSIASIAFPNLNLTAEEVLKAGR
ncbi:Uma2 family endonuclease [Oscillatoriales cyanobacterium LEGE 11467]|uniref:Uma2 family endonuclease n=1 Tax=Zarconia navalis LEGE 11467 TaxID=1828826 RepID=A0A928Z7B8_9CYAN|nr:Uma2 family endonuclease [Zarconia navalis]MBE9041287.1 Uma2 family endonuclease [Zarconia navalis LEGE 11467]